MQTRLAAAVFAGVVIGLMIPWFGLPLEARGQKPEKVPQWEYRVFPFGVEFDQQKSADGLTARVNQRAADGWEYVGPLGASAQAFGRDRATTQQTTYVSFKRPKR